MRLRAGVWRLLVAAAVAAAAAVGAAPAVAQEAAVQGIVLSASTGGAVEDVRMTLERDGEALHDAYTDRNGFYQLAGVAPGPYTLRAERIGFAAHEEEIALAAGERRTVSLRLDDEAVSIGGIVVAPERSAAVRELGRQVVTPLDIEVVPVPAGSPDLATYLQTLPGVTTTGDRGGQLYVRGGTPSENMALVDGVPIYQPFHIVGFFSLFPENLVSSADFYAGGFGARYSGRTSSVLDVRLRDGDPEGFRASASASPFLAEALLEGRGGPLDGGTWLISARRSLIEETSESLLGSVQPLTFESQLVKITSTREDNTRCSLLALRSADRGRIDPDDETSHVAWDNLAAGMRCSGVWPGGRHVETLLSYSGSTSDAVTRGASELRSKIWRLTAAVHSTSTVARVPVQTGVESYIEGFDYDMTELFSLQEDQDWVVGAHAYAEGTLLVGDRLEVRPGMVFVAAPNVGVEPRVRARWEPFGRESEAVQAAVGLYRQHVVGTGDLRDVGSVFVAWLEPDDPLDALHGRLGWEQTLSEGLHWSIEGYYNRMWHIPVPVLSAFARFGTSLGQADGESYGIDLRADYATSGFYAFLGYGYGRTVYEAAQAQFGSWFGESVQRYHPPHDRRHQLNAIVSAAVAGFEVSLRWQFGSGLPFTQVLGFDEAFRVPLGLSDVRGDFGVSRRLLDEPFGGRLPTVHRLDASVERALDVGIGDLVVQGGVINAYDRRNMFYYDLYTGRRLDQLSLAPYLAVSLKGK